MLRYHNNGVTRVTEFQNRRQHWIFPFSVGGDKCAACCIFVAPIYFRKADEQCAEVSCCPCCPKTQHTHSTKQKNKSCFIASFAFVLRPPSFGRPQRRKRARPQTVSKATARTLPAVAPNPLKGSFMKKQHNISVTLL